MKLAKIFAEQRSAIASRNVKDCQFRISVFQEIALEHSKKHISIDGERMRCFSGAWCTYVPALELKILYANAGRLVCLRNGVPNSPDMLSDEEDYGIYTMDDWRAALQKDVIERGAENFVAARLLAANGLGPWPYGMCVIKQLKLPNVSTPGCSVGMYITNVHRLKRRERVTESEFKQAGVLLDKLGSSLREQIRGYVSDLNSVVGSRPAGHETEIAALSSVMKQVMDLEFHVTN